MPFTIRLKTEKGELFEGPLHLLWHLIESYKVSIWEVSLSKITQDFFQYMQENTVSLSEESSFVYYGSKLLHYKSLQLLPKKKETKEDTLPEEVVEDLIAYKKFKLLSIYLIERYLETSHSVASESRWDLFWKEEQNKYYLDLSLRDLLVSYHQLLKKRKEKILFFEKRREEKEPVRLQEEIERIEKKIQKDFSFSFQKYSQYFSPLRKRVQFLALLELFKRGSILLKQEEAWGEILIEAIPKEKEEILYA